MFSQVLGATAGCYCYLLLATSGPLQHRNHLLTAKHHATCFHAPAYDMHVERLRHGKNLMQRGFGPVKQLLQLLFAAAAAAAAAAAVVVVVAQRETCNP